MAKQSFSVGQVLTAAQMLSLQQTAMLGGAASAKTANYTLIAADAGTGISMSSTSATTITVNTGLFAAGDTVQITNLNTGVCTITAGTATVNTSASLALAQYESGTLYFTSASASIFIKGAGAAPAGGGITLLSTTTVSSGATLTISGISTSYTNLLVTIQDLTCSGGQGDLRFKANGTNSITNAVIYRGTAASGEQTDFVSSANFSYEPIPGTNYNVAFAINIYDYANTSYHKPWTIDGAANIQSSSTVLNIHGRGKIATTSAITSLQFDFRNGQTFTNGVFKVYGVK
jgi:hypothetical protein